MKETSPQNSPASGKSHQTVEELSFLARSRMILFLQIITVAALSVLIIQDLVVSRPPLPPVPTKPAKELTLQERLTGVLDNLKQAQIKKDLLLYMSCYSYLFPTLDQKREEILKIWAEYNFTNMSFAIENIKPVDPRRALAAIAWTFNVYNLRTGEHKEYKQTFKADFVEELDTWRIRSLEEISAEKNDLS